MRTAYWNNLRLGLPGRSIILGFPSDRDSSRIRTTASMARFQPLSFFLLKMLDQGHSGPIDSNPQEGKRSITSTAYTPCNWKLVSVIFFLPSFFSWFSNERNDFRFQQVKGKKNLVLAILFRKRKREN